MSWDAATNKHKGFAFIEFETPEAAQLALEQMNGSLLGGRNVKVGRPSNMPQAQPIIDQLTEEAKNYNRIYLASIHAELSEQDVQSVFEAFGTIKSCNLIRDPNTSKHKGFGFIEYETVQASLDAIASMNLFDLGGQLLRVGKAVTPPENITLAPTAATLTQITGTNSLANASLASQMQDIDRALNSINAANAITQAAQAQVLATAAASATASITPTVATTTLTTTAITPTNSTTTSITNATSTASTTHQLTASLQKTNVSSPGHLNQVSLEKNVSSPVQTIPPNNHQFEACPAEPSQQQNQVELTENQKKLLGMTSADDPSASLEQQVDITLKGKEQRMMLMQKLSQRRQLQLEASRILVLRNMVGSEDVDEELENEITDECGKYGEVERVVIYQEKQGEEENAEVIVKIFVEFTEAKSIEKAIASLNGRFFAGRVVKAEIYDQSLYDLKDYSA
jgi:poly(U)-binding-splicing factor PUF60